MQPENTMSPMLVHVEGREIVSKSVQHVNNLLDAVVIEDTDKSTNDKSTQPANTFGPMLVTLEGIVTVVKLVQPTYVPESTDVVPAGIDTVVILVISDGGGGVGGVGGVSVSV
jgi:hypothetical protein